MKDTKSAFPHGGFMQQEGMTLRDYFAGQALTGIIARLDRVAVYTAKDAYIYADAMLEARRAQ
jgi:hypothetical protein